MRTIAWMTFSLLATCASAFAAPKNGGLTVINVYDLTQGDLDETMQGNCPEVAVEFPAHSTFPLRFFLKGDLISLVGEQKDLGELEIKQTFYARFAQGELILSSNLTEWKPFLEFITGNASLMLHIEEGKPSFAFGSENYRRL